MEIILIIVGLICILLGKTQWHKDYIEKHNFFEMEQFREDFRNILGGAFIFFGILAIIMN